jgi:hypothetical protein
MLIIWCKQISVKKTKELSVCVCIMHRAAEQNHNIMKANQLFGSGAKFKNFQLGITKITSGKK